MELRENGIELSLKRIIEYVMYYNIVWSPVGGWINSNQANR